MTLSTHLQNLLDKVLTAGNNAELIRLANGRDGVEQAILAAILSVAESTSSGMQIPAHDYFVATRIGTTNNISTITYKSGGPAGTVVATLTMTYFGAGATDDDTIQTVTLTLP